MAIRGNAEVVLRSTSGFADETADVIATRVLARAAAGVGQNCRRLGAKMPNIRHGGAASAAASTTSSRQMPMLADAACMAVVRTVWGMVDANELLSARPRVPLNLGKRLRRRRFLVGEAVALAALLLDKLCNEHRLASTCTSTGGYTSGL